MSKERTPQPPPSGAPPRDEFAWPPTTDELDSIEVIMLQQRSDHGPPTDAAPRVPTRTARGTAGSPRAPMTIEALRRLRDFRVSHLRVPRMRVPPVPMPRMSVSRVRVPGASGFVAAVMLARASREERPTRAEMAHWGLTVTSLIAIAVALALQTSEWRTHEMPGVTAIEPRATAAATQTEATTLEPLAPHSQADAAALASLTGDLVPLASAMDGIRVTPSARRVDPVAVAADVTSATGPPRLHNARSTGRAPAASLTRGRIDRERVRRSGAASSSASSAMLAPASVVSPPLRLPESYVPPRFVSSDRGRVRGKVVLGVQVGSNGRVRAVDVLSDDGNDDRDLERAAIAAVKQWRYRPALRDGVPTPARVKVVVKFS